MTLEATHRFVLLLGGSLSLIVIPTAISWRRRAFLKRADLRHDLVAIMWEKVFIFKAACDALLGIILLISLSVPPKGMVCKAMGVLYQFEEVMTLGIIIRMAQHPFYFMLKREDMNETRQYFNHTLLFSTAGGLLVCAPLVAFSSFGYSYSLCWLTSVPMQFYAFFIPTMLCLAFTVTILVRLARVANHRYASRLPTVYHGEFFRRVARGLELHFSFLAFVGVYPYAFRIASRAYLWQHGKQHPVLAFLEYLTIAFRGPLDALAYMPKDGIQSLYRAAMRWWRRRHESREQQAEADALEAGQHAKDEEEEAGVVRLTLLGKARPLGFFTDQPTRNMAEKRLFISTFNMAECSLKSLGGPAALAGWIPLGADLYVIGVQECMAYEGLGEALLAHVNGGAAEGEDEQYVMHSKAIGSTQKALGYHGLIAVWVLAKAKEVRANCFMLHESKKAAVARGKNLGVTVAENKGGVGLAFRYFDTTFAVLNTHLASDLKGRSRLHKRTKDACQLLLETSMWREDYRLDLTAQHHVCVFMGDLNFRLRRPLPGPVLEDVAAICLRERDGPCEGREDWRRLRYMELLRAAAGEADKGRYSLSEQPPSEAGAGAVATAPPSEEDEDEDEDEEDEDEEEEAGGGRRGKKKRRRRRRRLPALVGGLVRGMRSHLVLQPSFSSSDRQAQQEQMAPNTAAAQESGRPPSSSVAMTTQREAPLASSWEELLEADELFHVMSSGEAFYGFREPEIRFPPSYRRIKGAAGYCGDYTDAERLKQAYSIHVKEKALSLASRRLASALPGGVGLGSSSKSLGGRAGSGWQSLSPHPSQSSQLPQEQGRSSSSAPSSMLPSADSAPRFFSPAAKGKTTRIPSYTDRILVHTLPDYAPRVQVGPYDLCDALTASDHRPVSTLLRVQVNVGVRGLQTFQHGRRTPPPPTVPGAPKAAAPQRDVVTVHDAAFYLLELTGVSVDLGPGDSAEGTGTAPDDKAAVLCLFPLDNEDVFSSLRRPTIVAAVAKQLTWLTSEEERDPFAFLVLNSYGSVRRRGLSIVSCNRPEMGGLHASFALCDYRGAQLGSCVIALSDSESMPIPEIKAGVFPLTVGGCRCGTLRCDVRITQLWLDGSSVHH